jgi:hypothetical protein
MEDSNMAQSVLSISTERASKRMLFLLQKYKERFPDVPLPLDPSKVAAWAYGEGLWVPKDTHPQEILRRKLCRALRHEYILDPQGREVRANYASIEEVITPDGPKRRAQFYPIFKAPPEVARQALALDRKQALATVQQMKLDFDSYNDNNEFGAMLPPLDLDFNKDIEEMSLPVEYDPDPYGDEDDVE